MNATPNARLSRIAVTLGERADFAASLLRSCQLDAAHGDAQAARDVGAMLDLTVRLSYSAAVAALIADRNKKHQPTGTRPLWGNVTKPMIQRAAMLARHTAPLAIRIGFQSSALVVRSTSHMAIFDVCMNER